VHPLHVESVAWIAERKDVLSGLFWMLVLISYHTYVVRPGLTRYLVVLAMLSLGLMSKTMLVTLPCVLLLLDVWPFRRIDHPFLNRLPFRASASNGAAPDPSGTPRIPQISLTSDLLEKVPLLLLSSVASYLTLLAQRPAIESATVFVPSSIEERLSNALMSYVAYLEKMIWPFGLCCFYPYGVNQTSIAGLLVAIILLMAITYFAIVSFAKTPAILVGWLWYLGTLVPVIGLVQVGGQAMADRYTYLPLIGVFIALVWMLRPSYGGIRLVGLTSGLVTTILVGLVIRCDQQVATWQNTSTLFRQAYAVDPKNWRAAFFLAEDCVENGKLNMAVKFYREAASLLQTSDGFQVGCGVRLMKLGQITDAAECFAKAVQINPSEAEHHRRWGLTFVEQHQIKAAEEQFREAIRLKPDHAAAHSNLGAALMDLGQLREADLELREAIRLDPRDQIAVKNLEIVSEAIRKNPAP
jgi:Tfp pilus assembly protein PilF